VIHLSGLCCQFRGFPSGFGSQKNSKK